MAFGIILQKYWKFCNHQFCVFAILLTHEHAKLFLWQICQFNSSICCALLIAKYDGPIKDGCQVTNNFLTWQKIQCLQSLKFGGTCKNLLGWKKVVCLKICTKVSCWQIFWQNKHNFVKYKQGHALKFWETQALRVDPQEWGLISHLIKYRLSQWHSYL